MSAISASAQPASGVPVDFLGHRSYPALTRLVFATGSMSPERFRVTYDEGGRRALITPAEGSIAFSFEPVRGMDDTVLEVDYTQVEEGRLAIITRLGRSALGYRVSYLGEPNRLVLDIYRPQKVRPFLQPGRGVKKVALDPGHGGMHLGAVGPDGMNEADSAYSLALKLQAILDGDGYDVVVTRGEPDGPTPAERAGAANSAKADLYVSLHFTTSDATRVFTYDEGVLGDRSVPGNVLLWSDQQPPYLPDSLRLARAVAGRLKDVTGRGTALKHARLMGFEGVAMPAVMVEVGGFGDKGDGSTADEAYMDRLAGALADGIESYAEGGER